MWYDRHVCSISGSEQIYHFVEVLSRSTLGIKCKRRSDTRVRASNGNGNGKKSNKLHHSLTSVSLLQATSRTQRVATKVRNIK